jgi:hypothetical protein
MSSETLDDDEYPYKSGGSAHIFINSDIKPWLWRMRWFKRLILTAVWVVGILLIFAGYVAYRAVTLALLVGELEQRGCRVQYLHERSGQKDPLPEFLRDRLGNHVWSEVGCVSYYDFYRGGESLTAEDLNVVCNTCRKFPNLRLFIIESNHFSCDQIRNWPCLDRLEELQINSTKLNDADLAIIGKMPNLKFLKLYYAKIRSEGLGSLAKLKQLEGLGIYEVEFTQSAPQVTSGFVALKHLGMENSSKFGDEGVLALGPLPSLEKVTFNRMPVGDRTLEHLVEGGKVQTLIMNDSRVTDAGLKHADKCAAQLSLHLAGSMVTNEGLKALSGLQVSSLVLGSTAVTDDGLRHIADIQGLEYLSLDDTRVSGGGVSWLDRGEPLPALHLSGAPLTQEGIAVLAKARCTVLNLSRTWIGDKELMMFAGQNDLGELNVSETKVTIEGIRAFYRARKPRLGRDEALVVVSDFSDVAEEFVPMLRQFDPVVDIAEPPTEPGQQPDSAPEPSATQ